MNYLAKIISFDEDIEESITLNINGIQLTCFANIVPCKIEIGKTYQVELNIQIFNDYLVKEITEDNSSSILQIDNSFSYIFTGRLKNNYLTVGKIVFEDDVLLQEFGYLDGKLVSLKVDRIDVEFL